MATKPPIKIIKRKERAAQTPPEDAVEKKTTQQAARDMVATVSEWVTELQQRRRSETAQALKTLFSDTAPSLTKA